MIKSEKIILSSVYFGPLNWYSKFFSAENILIEKHENYLKQTYRNRCRIVGPNGVQDLVIPVHVNGNHTPIKDVRIDYDGNWQRQHWQSIRSAYGNSPFFDFYADYFSPFYSSNKYELLIDYNTGVFEMSMKILKSKVEFLFTEEYFSNYSDKEDLRNSFSPKKEFTVNTKPYLQVFQDRHGFISNLSIIDLLCCCGPDSLNILLSTGN